MANFYQSQQVSAGAAPNTAGLQYDIALVHSVVLNIDDIKKEITSLDKIYAEFKDEDYITKDGLYYGSILYRKPGPATEMNEDRLPVAYPLRREILQLPVKNETVKIYNIAGKDYYEKITPQNSPNFNTDNTLVSYGLKTTSETEGGKNNTINNYQETSQTGIANSSTSTNTSDNIKNGFAGKYFKRNMRIHQLAMNEGDTVLQGRFGHSIRFSGYIHDDKDNGTAYPAILIRNGENSDAQQKKIYDVISEDVNKDGTSIQITSGQYKTLFNSTNIEVNKEANNNYPSSDDLIGDQIVVNSGRVIISSKNAETFLFSKKTFSIFTDDIVTIDTEKGYTLISQNGNIEINAKNNKNIILAVNSGGKVFHGKDGADQQAVLGNKLVDLLGQLIDAIDAMTIATPSGPSAPGPIDKTPFNNIKNQLKDTLSKNNYLI
jgi:hypothetical protein